MALLRRSTLVLWLICLGCSAQSAPSDVALRVERQVRVYYSLPPNVKIVLGPLKPSEFPNYDATTVSIDFGDKKQNFDFLLSKDGKTLVRFTRMDLTKDPYAEVMQKINLLGRPARGNKDAKLVVVNYDDFQCPYCARMHQTLFPQVLKEYGDRAVFIYKDFPLSEIHPWATHAAVNANCLGAQNNDAYWEFADYIHGNQAEVSSEKSREGQFAALDRITLLHGQKRNLDLAKLQSCVKAQNEDAVKASVREGEGLGVGATPTLFINGQKVDGAVPISDLRAALDRALQEAGLPVPSHSAAASSPAPPASK